MKQMFQEGKLKAGDQTAVKEFSKIYVVSEKLVADYIKHLTFFINFQYQRYLLYQLILAILTLLTITIHAIQPLLTLPKNKTKQTIMSLLLMILTLHYTIAMNYGHRTTATTTTKKVL